MNIFSNKTKTWIQNHIKLTGIILSAGKSIYLNICFSMAGIGPQDKNKKSRDDNRIPALYILKGFPEWRFNPRGGSPALL